MQYTSQNLTFPNMLGKSEQGKLSKQERGGSVVSPEVKQMRQIMKQVPLWKVAIKNLEDEAETYRKMAGCIDAGAVDMSRVSSGTHSGNSPTEAAAARREKLEEKAGECERQQEIIALRIRKISRAMESLNDMEQAIIKGRYMEGKSLVSVSMGLYMSEKWARTKEQAALEKMAAMCL
jgi:DNA-directed RNA polymerase specialized sigma subunit